MFTLPTPAGDDIHSTVEIEVFAEMSIHGRKWRPRELSCGERCVFGTELKLKWLCSAHNTQSVANLSIDARDIIELVSRSRQQGVSYIVDTIKQRIGNQVLIAHM